jgi:hypothetical protein
VGNIDRVIGRVAAAKGLHRGSEPFSSRKPKRGIAVEELVHSPRGACIGAAAAARSAGTIAAIVVTESTIPRLPNSARAGRAAPLSRSVRVQLIAAFGDVEGDLPFDVACARAIVPALF